MKLRFPTGDIEDRVLQKWEIKKGVSWGTFWVPDHRLEDKVILDVRHDVFLVLKLHPDHFMYIL